MQAGRICTSAMVAALWGGGVVASGDDALSPRSGRPSMGHAEQKRGFDDGTRANTDARTVCNSIGPDVIVGELPDVANYASLGGIEAFAIGTTSCNIGDQELEWSAGVNRHPVIGQNLFRLNNGRFEHIGQSWLKHGFTALQLDACGCGCVPSGSGSWLGVGCSDPYSAGLNGSQSGLGPKFEVNAHTGYFEYPYTEGDQGPTGDSVYKRLQVSISDLDPAQNGGGMYFVGSQYVSPDDAAAGNGDNNASYREIAISGSGSTWNAGFSGMPATVREKPGIRAWKDHDPTVVETQVRVPAEGLILVSAKATDLGGGAWHYEYAVQNLNSDRSVGSFSVPVAAGATVQNIGFHDVAYHSGEPYDGTDWPGAFLGGAVQWSTVDYSVNSNGNALRWGALYNFRFDADVAPGSTTATLGLFKPGVPSAVAAATLGPGSGIPDCNLNGIDDACDVDCGIPGGGCDVPGCGGSFDCNTNGTPDECELFPTTPLATIRVAAGLSSPVFVCAPPGDFGRLFIVEQPGRIRILDLISGTVTGTPFLDISPQVGFGGEQGLLSMAFHPDYAVNGHFFVDYTDVSGDTVIARYSVSGNPDIADPSSAVIIKTIAQDFSNHNGGQLQFGPDGRLYVGMGDGGSAGDPNNRAQDLNSLLGKMLRLDVDAGPPYIPPDNPFVGTGGLDEIWAYGLRNPWRFSFDRLTGDMYIADVGQNRNEEIDFQPAGSAGGENYGWRCYEGNDPYDTVGCDPPGTMVFPILQYDHGQGCSVTGGYAYRGCAMPDLSGTYFYADYCNNWIRTFRYVYGVVTDPQDRTVELTPDVGSIASISSFGEDAAGELYICDLGGEVFKIVPAPPAFCGDGSCDPGEDCASCPQDCGTCSAYCPSTFSNTTDDWITNVTFNTINNDSGQDGPDSYGDYTMISTDVAPGSVHSLTVTFFSQGIWTEHVRAWIDWNRDGDLTGPGESYYLGSGVDATLSVDIAVPADAAIGSTRLRVIEQYGADPAPCDPHQMIWGETEDYTINVSAGADPIRGGLLWDAWWLVNGAPVPTGNHPLYPPAGTQVGSTTWRCKECHGWDYKGVNGAYGSGPHYTGIPGVFGSTMTPQQMFDIVQLSNVANGHGLGVGGAGGTTGMSDQDIWDVVAFMQTLVIDTDTYIDAGAQFLGDEVQGETHYTTGGTVSCIVCHGADGQAINFGTPEDPEWIGTVAVHNPWELLHKVRVGNPGTAMPSWLAGGGADQGVADIGRYAQMNFCTGDRDGDFDCDRDVDLADFTQFVPCTTGPGGGPLGPGCRVFDFDADQDADLTDFAAFQTGFTGPQ